MRVSRQQAPLAVVVAGLGAAGVAKLAAMQFTKDNFERWGYADPARFVIGAIEVGVAAAAVAGLRSPEARPVAAVGTLCSMAAALATHIRACDTAPNYVPPVLLTAAAITVLARD
ncbi:MAG: DoxX family protein [Actinomycetota bacterium]|nr:DoxX family protein [Actinomycetota bacterium]